MDNRSLLGSTFDKVASQYHQARPRYPSGLFSDLVDATGLMPRHRLLEVGSGTGIATIPLARMGFDITCIEPGTALVEEAKKNLASSKVRFINATFEDWQPTDAQTFDLVYSATAWHWTDPETRYRRAADVLRAGGYLAFWSALHVFPDDGDSFFKDIQPVYEEIGERLPVDAAWPRPGELVDQSEEVSDSGFFDPVLVRHYDWETAMDAETYINLLNTFSGHIAMADWQRDKLFSEIRRRISQRQIPAVRRHWGCALHVAQLKR